MKPTLLKFNLKQSSKEMNGNGAMETYLPSKHSRKPKQLRSENEEGVETSSVSSSEALNLTTFSNHPKDCNMDDLSCQNPLSIVTDDLHKEQARKLTIHLKRNDYGSATNSEGLLEEILSRRSPKITPHTFPAQIDDEDVVDSSESSPRNSILNGTSKRTATYSTRKKAGFRTSRGGRPRATWTAASGKKEQKPNRLRIGIRSPTKRHVAVNTTPTSQFASMTQEKGGQDKQEPCRPGTSVCLNGIVWLETTAGLLVINVTWRGRNYVGTLLDAAQHQFAPPRPYDFRAPFGTPSRGRYSVRSNRVRRFGIGPDQKLRSTRGSVRLGFQKSASCINLRTKESRSSPLTEVEDEFEKRSDDQRSDNENKRLESESSSIGEEIKPEFHPIQCPQIGCEDRFPTITELKHHLFSVTHESPNVISVKTPITHSIHKQSELPVEDSSKDTVAPKKRRLSLESEEINSLESTNNSSKLEDLSNGESVKINNSPFSEAINKYSGFLNSLTHKQNKNRAHNSKPARKISTAVVGNHSPGFPTMLPQIVANSNSSSILNTDAIIDKPSALNRPASTMNMLSTTDYHADYFKREMQKLMMEQNSQRSSIFNPPPIPVLPVDSPTNLNDHLANMALFLRQNMELAQKHQMKPPENL